MKKFTVSTSTPYDILIGHDLISKIGEFLKPVFSPRHVCVITDSTVNGLYAQVVMTSLIESG
ncbi:MAG: 3-dehydroquinate synthase, partial [[Eubacterium] sulci]|nr:3-dehydroquinate synthase [[Eubacterium] sulci]